MDSWDLVIADHEFWRKIEKYQSAWSSNENTQPNDQISNKDRTKAAVREDILLRATRFVCAGRELTPP